MFAHQRILYLSQRIVFARQRMPCTHERERYSVGAKQRPSYSMFNTVFVGRCFAPTSQQPILLLLLLRQWAEDARLGERDKRIAG